MIGGFSTIFENLLDYANEGIAFVFGGLTTIEAEGGGVPFFLNVLMPIVVISALIGILQYIRILPFVIKYIGLVLSKINGMGKLESYNAVASAILGQSEVFISVKTNRFAAEASAVHTMCLSHVHGIDVHCRCLYVHD